MKRLTPKEKLAIENLQSLYVFATDENGTLHGFAKATPPKEDIVMMQILGQSLRTLLSPEAYERFGNTLQPANASRIEFDATASKELAEKTLAFPGSSVLSPTLSPTHTARTGRQ